MSMICIYHSKDLDGFASGAIVKLKFPDVHLVGYDYGEPLPLTFEEFCGKDVIMADVCFPIVQMMEVSNVCNSFVYIDHHKSSIDEYKKHDLPKITPVLEIGISACELTWKVVFADAPMPKAIELLGKYDTWRDFGTPLWEDEIFPFQFGMRLLCNSPESFPRSVWSWDEAVEEVIKKGKIIVKYQSQINELNCKKNSFEFEFEGLRALCLNGPSFNIDGFKSVYDPEKHDILMPFQFTGKFWRFSLYTDKENIDCSAIAKKYGGGGHVRAAGFEVHKLKDFFKDF